MPAPLRLVAVTSALPSMFMVPLMPPQRPLPIPAPSSVLSALTIALSPMFMVPLISPSPPVPMPAAVPSDLAVTLALPPMVMVPLISPPSSRFIHGLRHVLTRPVPMPAPYLLPADALTVALPSMVMVPLMLPPWAFLFSSSVIAPAPMPAPPESVPNDSSPGTPLS